MKKVACLFGLALLAFNVFAQTIEQKHKQMVYPVVRVMTEQGGGSGTIIYSEDRSKEGEFETFVLTNHHVVESAIEIVTEWSSLLGKEIKVEKRKTVKVEVFRYENLSTIAGRESFDADVRAHSGDQDLAILQLRTKKKFESVATLKSKETSKKIFLFDRVVVVGCSLLHEPLITEGSITSLNDEIENKSFWMSNAQIIFGNSGGAAFGQENDSWVFIGVPSRISVKFNTPITHMGYIIPMPRIYEWFAEEKLDFLYDKSATPKESFQRRSELSKKSLMSTEKSPEKTPSPKPEGELPPPPKPN